MTTIRRSNRLRSPRQRSAWDAETMKLLREIEVIRKQVAQVLEELRTNNKSGDRLTRETRANDQD